MIDSHCHIGIGAEADKGEALETVLKRAFSAGVEQMLTVACSYEDTADLKAMIKRPNIWGAFGIHPENAADFNEAKTLDVFRALPQLVAYGEIGLDYYYTPETKETQCLVFTRQLELAHQLNLPVIIHTRDAEEDTVRILTNAFHQGLLKSGGVLHCFTGSAQLAEVALNLGLYLSASGIITFKNAENLRQVFQSVPLSRLLIETDSPYLAPVPYRGKANEPAFAVETLKQLAYIKQIDREEMASVTTQNFKNLFLKGKENEN